MQPGARPKKIGLDSPLHFVLLLLLLLCAVAVACILLASLHSLASVHLPTISKGNRRTLKRPPRPDAVSMWKSLLLERPPPGPTGTPAHWPSPRHTQQDGNQ